jgi:hypothetical protein
MGQTAMKVQTEKNKHNTAVTPVRRSRGYLHDGQPINVRSILHGSRIQPKLRVGQPNDKYEQEADQVAQQVMQQNSGVTQSLAGEAIIQRQEQPDVTVTEDFSPDPPATTGPAEGSARANRCYTNPEFPNFRCLAAALKLDVDENLRANAHQFYRTASLFPDDNELMWNTFMRYGLGVNLLQTSFGFLGADETLGTVLSYGTGIGLKSYDFFQNGVLELDVPIPLGQGVNLDLQLDLNADPDDLSNIRQVSAGVGFSGHF